MTVVSNVPKIPFLTVDNNIRLELGDNVRVQLKAKDERYPYSGGGYIGKLTNINHEGFTVFIGIDDRFVAFDDVFIIKKVKIGETFENTPYIDDEEKEFWRTHWHTRDGIKRKTQEDIERLEHFHRRWED